MNVPTNVEIFTIGSAILYADASAINKYLLLATLSTSTATGTRRPATASARKDGVPRDTSRTRALAIVFVNLGSVLKEPSGTRINVNAIKLSALNHKCALPFTHGTLLPVDVSVLSDKFVKVDPSGTRKLASAKVEFNANLLRSGTLSLENAGALSRPCASLATLGMITFANVFLKFSSASFLKYGTLSFRNVPVLIRLNVLLATLGMRLLVTVFLKNAHLLRSGTLILENVLVLTSLDVPLDTLGYRRHARANNSWFATQLNHTPFLIPFLTKPVTTSTLPQTTAPSLAPNQLPAVELLVSVPFAVDLLAID